MLIQTQVNKCSKMQLGTMGGLFAANPCEMTHKDVVDVLRNSYRGGYKWISMIY